jgi:hypothetical protein
MPPVVSVLIPTRNERWTQATIDDLLKNATGDIEIVVALEGFWPDPPLKPDPRVIVLHSGQPRGMRGAIEAAAEIARGTYLMKIDAHCLVGPGFDTILAAECDKDWVVVPRRYSLNVDNWCIEPSKVKQFIDAHYLCYPYKADRPDVGLHGEVWMERTRARQEVLIDDEMSSQGSCWFMHREHFWKRLGGMPLEGYGRFVQEFQQIGMKTWLGGGRCVVNKKTFYAHLHKGKRFGRGYYISKPEMIDGAAWSADYWLNNRWPGRVADFKWLMEKFWPVPTWGSDFDAAMKAITEKRPLV